MHQSISDENKNGLRRMCVVLTFCRKSESHSFRFFRVGVQLGSSNYSQWYFVTLVLMGWIFRKPSDLGLIITDSKMKVIKQALNAFVVKINFDFLIVLFIDERRRKVVRGSMNPICKTNLYTQIEILIFLNF